MDSQQITITLPQPLYERVKQQSQRMQRSVAEELLATVAAALPARPRSSAVGN